MEAYKQRAAEGKTLHAVERKVIPSSIVPLDPAARVEILSVEQNLKACRIKYQMEMIARAEEFPDKVKCDIHEGEFRLIDMPAIFEKNWSHKGEFIVCYGECSLCKSERLVNERHGKWIAMGVPKKVAHATFENYQCDIEPKREAKEKTLRQAKKGRGFIILVGTYGTGKSHLAAATLKFFGGGIFATHASMTDLLRETYESGGKTKLVSKLQNTPCLVIDEIDDTVAGADVATFLYTVLAYRFDRDKITVLTSNVNSDSVAKVLGHRLQDRMASNYEVANFTWTSYRRQHREV